MGTASVEVNQNQDNTADNNVPVVTEERETYVVGYNLSTDEKTGAVKKEPAFYPESTETDKGVNKLITDGKFEENYRVTVSIPRAKNFEGIARICPDEEEAAANFNRGAKQKAANRLKAKLLDVNEDNELTFNPESELTNGVLDMTSEIASPSKRKVLTVEEKLLKSLEQYPEAIRAVMLKAFNDAKAQGITV